MVDAVGEAMIASSNRVVDLILVGVTGFETRNLYVPNVFDLNRYAFRQPGCGDRRSISNATEG